MCVFLCCILFACQKKNIPTKTYTPNKDSIALQVILDTIKVRKERRKNFPDVNKFKAFLDQYSIDTTKGGNEVTIVLQKDRIVLDSLTFFIYKENNNKSFWNDTAKCNRIIQLLKNANYDGLLPKDYGIPALDSMYKKCFLKKGRRSDTLYWRLELEVTKNYLHFLKHVRFGKTNPEDIFDDWDYKKDGHLPHTPSEYSKLLGRHPDSVLSEFRPQYPMYKILRDVLYRLDSIKHNPHYEWDLIPYIGKDLKLGDTASVIIKIKHRLLSVGIGSQDSITSLFDEELLATLSYFQQHVGLTANGKIDKATINKLNFTVQEIEDVVRVNMERCRWLAKGVLPNYYIIVNIADFNLRIYKDEKQVYKTKVVVGSTNKETPIFHSKMTTIEFNPHWTVPISISGNEILPKLKSDPEYLSRNNMELLRGDSAVHVTDFSSYSKNNFPFVVRQRPGGDNSLGRVKFLFPNPYSVYLHDTPSKSLFEKDIRAFSHGCVRIYKPLDLAAFLLAEQGITPKNINEIVESGKNTVVGLKTRIPIFITYWTCFTDDKNQVFFFKDIYGRDKKIIKELNN